ncbi:PDC sensor domain-containing protein [Crassaminicella thermophila]|nr:hypothetical protein [Crassaminicella thermophila]
MYAVDKSGVTIAHPNKEYIGSESIKEIGIWDEISSKNNGFIE